MKTNNWKWFQYLWSVNVTGGDVQILTEIVMTTSGEWWIFVVIKFNEIIHTKVTAKQERAEAAFNGNAQKSLFLSWP